VHKWLTIGLDNNEKNGAVAILAIIIFGSLFYGISHLLYSYEEKITMVVSYIFKIIIGTILIGFLPLLFYDIKIRTKNSDNQGYLKYMLIVSAISLILSIVMNYLYGEIIIFWLKNNWFFLLGGLILVLLISNFVGNKSK